MKLAAVQMPIADGEHETNCKNLEWLLDANPGADIYLAPELWTSGYALAAWEELADEYATKAFDWMRRQACKRQIWLGGSVIARTEEGGLANRFILCDRSGEIVMQYDKTHRFLPMGETVLIPGGQVPILEVEGFRVAPAICYDLRFPEMFRRLAIKGVDLFLVCSEWPCPRQEPLITLASARAIENQAYVLLANRTAYDSQGQVFCGNSGIYGPLGKVSALGQIDCGVVMAELDVRELQLVRQALPVFAERRKGVDYD